MGLPQPLCSRCYFSRLSSRGGHLLCGLVEVAHRTNDPWSYGYSVFSLSHQTDLSCLLSIWPRLALRVPPVQVHRLPSQLSLQSRIFASEDVSLIYCTHPAFALWTLRIISRRNAPAIHLSFPFSNDVSYIVTVIFDYANMSFFHSCPPSLSFLFLSFSLAQLPLLLHRRAHSDVDPRLQPSSLWHFQPTIAQLWLVPPSQPTRLARSFQTSSISVCISQYGR